MNTLSFKEDHISQIPALQMLLKLGYAYLAPEQALKLRGGKTTGVLLEEVLRRQLKEVNSSKASSSPCLKRQTTPYPGTKRIMSEFVNIFDMKSLYVDSFNMNKRDQPYNDLPDLPPGIDLNTPELLKGAIKASRLLAELKGYCQTLPNPKILINTIILQESKDSSAIENIVTTQDELYRAMMAPEDGTRINSSAKEVLMYKEAIYLGLELLERRGLTTNTLVSIMQKLKDTTAGVRRGTGTRLANPETKEIMYTPPEGEELIRNKLTALERFIHSDDDALDPLIRMALMHYQFEAIHPFADGNGRTGRIMNVLYLVHMDLLPLPVLYLSSFIIHHKSEYYRLLREVTEKGNWKEWILYMLKAISETAALSLQKIKEIQQLKDEIIETAKEVLKSSYNRDLVDLLFCHPYVKIKTLEQNNIGHRQTASTYLQKLAKVNVLTPFKMGKEIYYINHRLMKIIST